MVCKYGDLAANYVDSTHCDCFTKNRPGRTNPCNNRLLRSDLTGKPI